MDLRFQGQQTISAPQFELKAKVDACTHSMAVRIEGRYYTIHPDQAYEQNRSVSQRVEQLYVSKYWQVLDTLYEKLTDAEEATLQGSSALTQLTKLNELLPNITDNMHDALKINMLALGLPEIYEGRNTIYISEEVSATNEAHKEMEIYVADTIRRIRLIEIDPLSPQKLHRYSNWKN